MNIAVLAGGLSPERDVSLTSGALIANSLISSGHRVCLADVYCGIRDIPRDVCELFTDEKVPPYSVSSAAPDLEALVAAAGGREAPLGEGIIELCRAADVVFLALHGGVGENGQLQAAFDCHGIKAYTGTGYVGALLAMDKDITKRLLAQAGVPSAEWRYYLANDVTPEKVEADVGLPCVIKPTSGGSSVGVTIVKCASELAAALAEVQKWEKSFIAEKMIEGRELTVGILDGRALPAVEIIPKTGFYDYKNKYQSGLTEEICPAPLTAEQSERLADLALRAFSALRMETYARIDFILGKDGEFYCLEANALPGMTPTSLLPQAAEKAGISYDELCRTLAELAYKKNF